MKINGVWCFVFIVIISFSFSKKKMEVLPGTIEISNNYYVDQTEIKVIDWREYQYWNIYYTKSFSSKFDSTVWRNYDKNNRDANMEDIYYSHPVYNEYPIVGITYKSALEYCKWRSDRVFEYQLIKRGILKVDKDQIGDFFTIEKYFNGTWKNIKPDYSITYPYYSLPTMKEWLSFASGGNDLDSLPFGVKIEATKNWFGKINNDTLELGVKNNSSYYYGPSHTGYGKVNNYKLRRIIGGVSEMLIEPGIAAGGNWTKDLNYFSLKDTVNYIKPNNWLGFRCVAKYKVWTN
tara:strand:- start:312 stop:1184 length:873 start_codon:yes stop_codon:yes gene_type:complete